MLYRVSKNRSELLDVTQTCPKKLLKIARHDPSWPGKTAQNVSKWGNECLKGRCACIYKCDSCHYLALLLPVKVSVNCAEVIPAATFITLNRQFQLNWQGSLVIRLTAIVSIDGLSCTIIIALIEKNSSCPQFLLFHYCLLVIPQSNMNFRDVLCFFWDLKAIGYRI